jgi:hypothetical protein
MKTTYRKIIEHNSCVKSVNKMLRHNNLEPIESLSDLDPSIDLSTEISLKEILDICGIKDAIWCLRTQEGNASEFFTAVVELILPVFEDHFPGNTCVRDCVKIMKEDKDPSTALKAIRETRVEVNDINITDAIDWIIAAVEAYMEVK